MHQQLVVKFYFVLKKMFGKVWEMKKMYDKYRTLQKTLKKLVIRRKEWVYLDNWEEVQWAIIVEINWEMKLQKLSINDNSLLSVDNKEKLEDLISEAFQKAQNKAQELIWEKTKEVLWFDPSDLWNMMWWWLPWLS